MASPRFCSNQLIIAQPAEKEKSKTAVGTEKLKQLFSTCLQLLSNML
jgi:hypothetical protein